MIDRTRGLKDILWFLILFGAVAMIFRLWYGLGATTNLSDEVPWGLWKIMNMVAGVALATCGFTVGLLVYVLRMESLRPMMKPAILVAFLGYGSSVFALILDIGIPYRIWHPVFMWNEHSFLFEVAWCVMLYFTVTIIELSPTLLERFRLQRVAGFLHRIAFGVVIVGIALSSLHHSSLGSLFLVTPQRLHPLWFTPRIPFLFIISAAGTGLMVAVLAKLFHSYVYDPASIFGKGAVKGPAVVCAPGEGSAAPAAPGRDLPMLQKLASIASWILALYLVLKIADLFAVGAVPYLLAMTWESYLYLGEIIFLAVLPLLLMIFPKTRRSPAGLAIAAGSTALGLVWNRLNVGIFGYYRDADTVYFPSLVEWALSLGIIAAAGMVFLYACEYFPIFDEAWQLRRQQRSTFLPSFDRISGVWNRTLTSGVRRTSLIAVLTVPLAWAVLYPPFTSNQPPDEDSITPPLAIDVERSVLKLDGNKRFLNVDFPHSDHQVMLGDEDSCEMCHHLSLPNDNSTPCSRCHRHMSSETNIFDHSAHMEWVAGQKELAGVIPANHSCTVCHAPEGPKQGSTAVTCLECHQEDMKPVNVSDEPHGLAWASGYQTAMHKTCAGTGCHSSQSDQAGGGDVAECSDCHRTRGSRSELARLTAVQ